jgi:hypothetical protein
MILVIQTRAERIGLRFDSHPELSHLWYQDVAGLAIASFLYLHRYPQKPWIAYVLGAILARSEVLRAL